LRNGLYSIPIECSNQTLKNVL